MNQPQHIADVMPTTVPTGRVLAADELEQERKQREAQAWHDENRRIEAEYRAALHVAGVPKLTNGMTWLVVAAAMDEHGDKAGVADRIAAALDPALAPRAWIYLHGPFGTGKTVAATALFKHLLWTGASGLPGGYKSGLWRKWYSAVREVQAGYSDGTADAKLRALQTAPLLLIDDLGDVGRAGVTDDQRRLLYEIIDARADSGAQTLITSNLTVAEMAADFGPRTAERIDYLSVVAELAGHNYRTKPIHA